MSTHGSQGDVSGGGMGCLSKCSGEGSACTSCIRNGGGRACASRCGGAAKVDGAGDDVMGLLGNGLLDSLVQDAADSKCKSRNVFWDCYKHDCNWCDTWNPRSGYCVGKSTRCKAKVQEEGRSATITYYSDSACKHVGGGPPGLLHNPFTAPTGKCVELLRNGYSIEAGSCSRGTARMTLSPGWVR